MAATLFVLFRNRDHYFGEMTLPPDPSGPDMNNGLALSGLQHLSAGLPSPTA